MLFKNIFVLNDHCDYHTNFVISVCQIYGCITGLAGLVTINTLAVIAIDRYNAIVRRVNNVFDVSTGKAMIAISVIWIYALIFATGPFYGWSAYRLEGVKTTCTFDFLSRDWNTMSFIISMVVCEFLVPVMIIATAYAKIIKEVFAIRRELFLVNGSVRSDTLHNRRQRFRTKSETRTALIVFGLVILFCVAWTPYVIVAMIGQFGNREMINPYATIIPSLIAKTSTVSNPIVYAISHPKFKRKIVEMFRRKFNFYPLGFSKTSTSIRSDSNEYADQRVAML